MGNKFKGEVSFTANGQDYTAKFSTNAICCLEERLGKTFEQITMSLGYRELRAFLYFAIQQNHPGVSLEDTGDILDDLGMAKAQKIIADGLKWAMPESKGAKKK